MEILVTREKEWWVQQLVELRTYAADKRLHAERAWDEAWRVYNNQYDWSGKAEWQSRVFVPKAAMAVEMAAALVRRALLESEDWFRLEGLTETSRKRAPYLEKLLYYYLDRMRFVDRFIEPLKGGLVGSLIVVKPHLAPWSYRERDGRFVRELHDSPAITVSFPDPYNIYLDPTGRGMFIIEEEILDLPTAFDLADMGILDGDVLKQLHEDWLETERQAKEDERKRQPISGSRPTNRLEVKLTHFWGSLPDRESGRWALKNGHFIIVNDKYVVRGPMENPYPHKRLPYIVGSPFRRPFSVYHKGLLDDVVGLQKAMTELVNLTLDSATFAGIKAFEVDLDQIEDPQQLLSGIYPGKVFTKRGGGQQGQMVKEINIADVNRSLPALYQLLNNEFQNSTAVTEFISGQVGMRGARTATEVVIKQNQGMGIFNEVAKNLENSVLEPTLEQLAYLVVEYHEDFIDPRVAEILGTDLMIQMLVADRGELFEPQNLRVRASGITALLSRSEEIQRIMGLLQVLGQFGPVLPVLAKSIDLPHFFEQMFRRMVRAYGWPVEDLVRPPAEPVQIDAGPPEPRVGMEPQEGAPAPPVPGQRETQLDEMVRRVQAGGLPIR